MMMKEYIAAHYIIIFHHSHSNHLRSVRLGYPLSEIFIPVAHHSDLKNPDHGNCAVWVYEVELDSRSRVPIGD